MTKSTITRERIQQIFLGNGPEPSASEERELARMALAAMDGEPVAATGNGLNVALSLTQMQIDWICNTCASIYNTRNDDVAQGYIDEIRATLERLAAMDSEPVELPLDYLQGRKDGLEWAARLAEANHPDTGDWLYDDPIELSKAIRKGRDMPPVQPVADSEPDRNPVLAYADSYRDMAKQGVESVPIWSVITDLERNIAPLYRHAQPVTVVPDKMTAIVKDEAEYVEGWNASRPAMLVAAPQSHGSEPATVPGKWIPVSERMPPSRHEVLVGRWWGEKPRWCCKWATYIPGHPDSQSSGWLIPGASWTPTHWMELPAAPQEPKP